MIVRDTEGVPIKMWLDDLEDGAYTQARNIAELPYVFKHVAIMPDSHQGYSLPIGGVVATNGVVSPLFVGVDIGCGMLACKTNLESIETDKLERVIDKIKNRIPVGFKKHNNPKNFIQIGDRKLEIVRREESNANKSLGTLGGGNHFIEIQKGSDGHIWFMIHSGSRNLGKQVADHYNKIAKDMNKIWHSEGSGNDLAFLPVESDECDDYLEEMNFCLHYALSNRTVMKDNIVESFKGCFSDFEVLDTINIAHNYARLENHFGKNVMVHRKGATSAKSGELGIIPGSQGTKSYIVEGLGNPESFCSCSHGAGRKMSRTKAKKELDLNEEIKKMDDLGVVHGIKTVNDLDEASGAYKDIDTVMENQKDLVKIKVELSPLGVIKG